MQAGEATNAISSAEAAAFTSRIQKGGALLPDMRKLVAIWSDEAERDPVPFVMRVLAKPSLARARDTYIRAFRPRFLQGSPVEAWRLARLLEEQNAPFEVIVPFYYWITVRAEPILYGFVCEDLVARVGSHRTEVTVEQVMDWLGRRLAKLGKSWTPTIQRKVSRAMLAGLRDFGILEGKAKKRLAAPHLPLPALCLIAFTLHSLGASGRGLLEHDDWRPFLLDERSVERSLLEADQRRWLSFQAAGRISRVEFPTEDFKEYLRVVLG